VNALHSLDDRLFLAINSFARSTPWIHGLVLAYATYGVVLFAVLLLAGLVLSRRSDSRVLAAAGWAAVAMLVAVAVNQPVGHLFAEARPYTTHPQILRLADVSTDFSFPSDHAVMAGAVAAGLLLVSRRLGLLAVLAAVVMAFSRVYIAAHYPWDVLGGMALGAAVALLGWALLRVPLTALTAWLRRLPGLRAIFEERPAEPQPSGAVDRPSEVRA
jgi:undecaprenyl-diphosphatase